MNLYRIDDFSMLIGVTQQTLRNWDKRGKLKPYHVSENGCRYYSQAQLNQLLHKKEPAQRIIVGYAHVSSSKQKDKLERQIENVKMYMLAKGYSFQIISDIGSAINNNTRGLNRLLELIVSFRVEKIVVLRKDRLFGFSFNFMEIMCGRFGTSIEIIDQTETTDGLW